jgi:hypothetical protein
LAAPQNLLMTGRCASGYKLAMRIASATYFFWFFGYPRPKAEEGVRTI